MPTYVIMYYLYIYLCTSCPITRDAMAESLDKQKEQADAKCRGCIDSYEVSDQVLLNAKTLPTKLVSAVFKTKLRPRFIGPYTVVAKKGLAYTLNLPRKLRTHPVFYVGLLKPYRDPSLVDLESLAPRKLALPQAATSEPTCQVDLRLCVLCIDLKEEISRLTFVVTSVWWGRV